MELYKLENRVNGGIAAFGSVWKKGEAAAGQKFILLNDKQEQIPVQSRITAYWPDGSIKWATHTADSVMMGERAEIILRKTAEGKGSGSAHLSAEACGENAEDSMTPGMWTEETDREFLIKGKHISMRIPKKGDAVLEDLYINGSLRAVKAIPVLLLEERTQSGSVRRDLPGTGTVEEVTIEEAGQVACDICIRGCHEMNDLVTRFPFILRIRVGQDSSRLDFTHTFFYDGDENKEFLKGIGIRFHCPVEGESYNRHVAFGTDNGRFHEALGLLLTWRPRIPEGVYRSQIAGKLVDLSGEEESIREAAEKIPIWSNYHICQDSSRHFMIRKKVEEEECCYLDCLHGSRAPGVAAFGGTNGGLLFAMRDFWRKYPSGFSFEHLSCEQAEATVWFWSPEAQPMDFRHYAVEGYDQTYYEGFPEVGATPFGIANTSTFSISGFEELIPDSEDMKRFGEIVEKPAVYVGSPQYYHERKAFGRWSLPSAGTEAEKWLEEQLDRAVDFYKQEVEVRDWYGMFNYGDFMHTYDRERHCWRYDCGGYAWQNTELVPTIWLWLAFLRTGREDIFTMAEAMSRHCSEVDVYHFGPLKGIGSRHNVRHWGCSCKEARIAMAGHHRYYYYLTGDLRMGDIFEDVKDGDFALLNMDPLRYFYSKDEMNEPTHARSGPDWSSFCSNWMTRWERFGDISYEKKIRTGIEDIKRAPLKLVSGPDFEYNPDNSHLRYIGERAAGGTHLQICMGAAQVWIELGELLGDEEWKRMMAEYGRFYFLDRESQLQESGGLIGDREFSLPFMAAAMGAYGADYLKDKELARITWLTLLRTILAGEDRGGFAVKDVIDGGNRKVLKEIPWISTNFTAQWCLNVIMALEFIGRELPEEMNEVVRLLEEFPLEGYHKS